MAKGYALGQALQRQLANSIVMYINYKLYHWRAYGPLFRDLHLLFDEHAGQVLGTVDLLGERMRIIGAEPEAELSALKVASTVKQSKGSLTLHDMLQEGLVNHNRVIKECKEGLRAADEADDPGTSQLFGDVISVHEKASWFVREVLQKGDGLVT